MASEPVTGHLPPDVLNRFKDFKDDHGLSKSKAAERAIDRGLTAYGYANGGNEPAQTRLARVARQLASATVGATAVLLMLGFLQAWVFVEFVPVLLATAAGLMMVVYWEPRISLRLARHGRRMAAVVGVG